MKGILLIFLNSLHKILMDSDGNIGFCHLLQVGFQFNKLRHIRMGAVDRNHQSSSPAVLSDKPCYQRIQLHKGYGSAGLLCCIIDLGSPWAQLGNIDSAASAVTVSPCQFFCAVKYTFNIIFRRSDHITVGISNLPSLFVQSSVR